MELSTMIEFSLPFLVLFIGIACLGVGFSKANSHLRRGFGISWLIVFLIMAVVNFGDLTKLGENEVLTNAVAFWKNIQLFLASGWSILVLIIVALVCLVCCSHDPDISWGDPNMRRKARAIYLVAILSGIIMFTITLVWLNSAVAKIIGLF